MWCYDLKWPKPLWKINITNICNESIIFFVYQKFLLDSSKSITWQAPHQRWIVVNLSRFPFPFSLYAFTLLHCKVFRNSGLEIRYKFLLFVTIQWHIGIPFPNTTLSHFFYYGKTWNGKNIHLRLWFFLTVDTEKVLLFELMAMFMS